MEKPKVEGFTVKKFFERLSKKRHAQTNRRGEFFGTVSTPTLTHVLTNIQQITDEELAHVVTRELLRRQSLTLNDIKHTLEATMKENKAIQEKKRKEALKRQKEAQTPLRRYLLLAQLNSEHHEERLEALMKWNINDLKDVAKQIGQKRTMREIPIKIFEQSHRDLLDVISYKTMLGEGIEIRKAIR